MRKMIYLNLMGTLLLSVLLGVFMMGTAQGQEVAKIGVIQPLTGAIAYGGQAAANGHKMAVKEINDKGGIDIKGKNYKIDLIIEDSKGVPKESVAATNKLISRDRVPLIMGDFTSSCTFASAEVCEREEIPIISPLSSSPKLTSVGFKYFFRGRVTTGNNVAGAAKFFADLGHKRIAMLAINDDWGRGDTTLFPPEWKKLGVEVVAMEYFDQGQSDFYPVLTKLAKTNPSAIFVTASTEPAAMIFKQAREVAANIALLTSGGIDPTECLRLAGAKAMEGLWFWSVDPPATPEILAFDKKYEEMFKSKSMSNAKSGYDVAIIVGDALKRAGTVKDPKAIRDALAKTKYKGYMGDYYFDEKGESFLKMNFGIFKGGAFTIQKGP
jgi:branched-chain amino acid transport system substrate-binding protein